MSFTVRMCRLAVLALPPLSACAPLLRRPRLCTSLRRRVPGSIGGRDGRPALSAITPGLTAVVAGSTCCLRSPWRRPRVSRGQWGGAPPPCLPGSAAWQRRADAERRTDDLFSSLDTVLRPEIATIGWAYRHSDEEVASVRITQTHECREWLRRLSPSACETCDEARGPKSAALARPFTFVLRPPQSQTLTRRLSSQGARGGIDWANLASKESSLQSGALAANSS